MKRKLILCLSIVFAMVIMFAGTVYALPPMPGGSGSLNKPGVNQPPVAGEPNLPDQPILPPCPECDEFREEEPSPTPSPQEQQPSPTPTTTPSTPTTPPSGGTQESGGSSGGSAAAAGAAQPTGEVLGLSATSGEEYNVLTVLGTLCILAGMGRLLLRKIQLS